MTKSKIQFTLTKKTDNIHLLTLQSEEGIDKLYLTDDELLELRRFLVSHN